jgi:Flp pilus assembly CpaE family ATPase
VNRGQARVWCSYPCWDAGVDLGGRWYIIGVLNARELREGHGAGEEGAQAASGGLGADQPSVIQLRVRVLEMSSVFAELSDGALRALARRMQAVKLAAGDTLRLSGRSGDVVFFLATGVAEQSITDAGGKLLLTRRPAPGDLLILPAPRTGDRYVTSIRGLSESLLLTLDRDGLLAGLGQDIDKVVIALDKLWDQQVAAATETEAQAASRTSAPIVAFFSAKGGSGVSTLAVNTAAALAGRYPRQVVLIDLSAPFGHAALFADLVATGSIAGASKAAPEDFEKNLRGAIVYHKTGLGVLPGTLRPEQVDLMTADLTGRALDVAGKSYRLVVADLGTSLAEAALVVIERAERLVVVVPPEIAAMTDARRSLAVFRDIMNVPDSRLELVLNNRVPGAPLDRGAVESILGHKMSLTIGFDDSRPEDATLAGSLLLQRDPNSQVSRGATELARAIVGKLKLDG